MREGTFVLVRDIIGDTQHCFPIDPHVRSTAVEPRHQVDLRKVSVAAAREPESRA